MSPSNEFIVGLPKAELHVHIEGTITPHQKWELARRNGVPLPYADYDEFLAAHDYSGATPADVLKKFLDLYYANHVIFKSERDYRDVMYEHLRRCKEGNIRYCEVFFGAQAHLNLGIPIEMLMEGLRAGLADGLRDFGVHARMVLSINRSYSAESSLEMVKALVPYQDIVVGIGAGGYEPGNPPVKMKDAFAFARAQGWHLTCHCDVDQDDSVKHIWQCVNDIGVDRIDHGINALDDPRLVDTLNERGIYLTPCPTWWSGSDNPYRLDRIRTMYDAGLNITLNSDDPGMMSSGMLHELLPRVVRECAFDHKDLGRLMTQAFEGSWISPEFRAQCVGEVREYVARNTPVA